MADIPFSGNAPGPESRQQGGNAMQTLGTITNWAGAAVSLALIAGIGVWGYKMLARDVSGVPVVRAASGEPMRVQPQDPGGSPALHQGLAVNRVAAEGAAEKPADRLILAPPPVSLEDEDMPGAAIEVAAGPDEAEAATPAATPQMGSIQALADQLAGGSAPLGTVEEAPEKLQQAAVSLPATPEPEPARPVVKGGIKQSLRPVLRPGGLRDAVAAAVPVAAALDVDPSTIPAGTRLAQLGAFDSAETARGEWDKLSQRFGDYLEGKQRVIQRATSGGRVFYRLRAMGFADMSDARRFCSALVAERADCIPVTTK